MMPEGPNRTGKPDMGCPSMHRGSKAVCFFFLCTFPEYTYHQHLNMDYS